jgi:hypothetical protein
MKPVVARGVEGEASDGPGAAIFFVVQRGVWVHLKAAGFPIYADDDYGDGQQLFLSSLKRSYRLKEGAEERPLTPSLALHAWKLTVTHPVGGHPVEITAPWPADLEVALKYLRRYAV